MKNVLIAFVLAFTAQANARSMIAAEAATLTRLHFAQGSQLAGYDIQGGEIALDYIKSEVTLTLFPSFRCHAPEGAMCAQVMPAPVIVTLPLISREVDSCGSVHYLAKKDQRPVDGINQEIEVINNSGNRCLTFVALPPTDVKFLQQGYDRMGQSEFNYRHSFTADALQAH